MPLHGGTVTEPTRIGCRCPALVVATAAPGVAAAQGTAAAPGVAAATPGVAAAAPGTAAPASAWPEIRTETVIAPAASPARAGNGDMRIAHKVSPSSAPGKVSPGCAAPAVSTEPQPRAQLTSTYR